uniref:Disease resistance N-terminal domain-containing protein n=1 Tax=Aegilops tauschii TaxID=37682 RepID=M8BZB8_AEGTA
MVDALIGPLVGRLQGLALSQAQALVAVKNDIGRLGDKLMFLQAFLREADAKHHLFSDEITRVWLKQTRDAVFDAEDAVDHYYVQVDMSRLQVYMLHDPAALRHPELTDAGELEGEGEDRTGLLCYED